MPKQRRNIFYLAQLSAWCNKLGPPHGFEPQFTPSKGGVLPLDEGGMMRGAEDSNPHVLHSRWRFRARPYQASAKPLKPDSAPRYKRIITRLIWQAYMAVIKRKRRWFTFWRILGKNGQVTVNNFLPRTNIPKPMKEIGLSKNTASPNVFVTSKANKMKRAHIAFYPVALFLASCTTATPRTVTRDVLVPQPVPCITADQRAAIEALLPGNMGPWLPDARAREGRYLERLSQYRGFADGVRAVLPGCAG